MSSPVKKLFMSISGLFLILFLTLHMSVNLIAVFSLPAYDKACRFMGTNPLVRVMVPVLAAGFIVHIVYAIILTLKNQKARGGERYAVSSATKIGWPSKNMMVLGIIILGALLIHLTHFWAKMQLQEFLGKEAIPGSILLLKTFGNTWNVFLYIVWILAIAFHLSHGFWSAFQTVGWSNGKWAVRIKIIAHSYMTLLIIGFLTTVIYFYIQSF